MSLEILTLLIDTLGVGVIGAVIAVAVHYIRKFNLENWVERAVKAAEIIFDVPDSGEQKKEWVLNFLKENVDCSIITEEMLDVLIEAAVEAINLAKSISNKE